MGCRGWRRSIRYWQVTLAHIGASSGLCLLLGAPEQHTTAGLAGDVVWMVKKKKQVDLLMDLKWA